MGSDSLDQNFRYAPVPSIMISGGLKSLNKTVGSTACLRYEWDVDLSEPDHGSGFFLFFLVVFLVQPLLFKKVPSWLQKSIWKQEGSCVEKGKVIDAASDTVTILVKFLDFLCLHW